MNFIFIFLNTANSIIYYFPNNIYSDSIGQWSEKILLIATYIFIFSYGVNFYIMISVNLLFRREFYKLLSKNNSSTKTNTRISNRSGDQAYTNRVFCKTLILEE